MWLQSFQELLGHSNLASAILEGQVRLLVEGNLIKGQVLNRISALLATRLSLVDPQGKDSTRLILIVPPETLDLGFYITIHILFAEIKHRLEHERLGPRDRLFTGDLLLITQQSTENVQTLRKVEMGFVGSKPISLKRFWPVEVFSRYVRAQDATPRVYVGNPGWIGITNHQGAFGCTVIDATHPRTAKHLEHLLIHPDVASSSLQILVVPPLEPEGLTRLQKLGNATTLTWGWDPAAVRAIEEILPMEFPEITQAERNIWVCADPEIDTVLTGLHQKLVGASRETRSSGGPQLLEAWSIYHGLRQLSVPLLEFEEHRQGSYGKTTWMKDLTRLSQETPQAQGASARAYLEIHWPQIVQSLQNAYTLLIERNRPIKFQMLMEVLETSLNRRGSKRLRVVSPSQIQNTVLVKHILRGHLVAEIKYALHQETLSFVTASEELRLMAEGQVAETILFGFRSGASRPVDVYASYPVHLLGYPYEVEVDAAIQKRTHRALEELQEDATRMEALTQLQLQVSEASALPPPERIRGLSQLVFPPRSKQPPVHLHYSEHLTVPHLIRLNENDKVEPLDFETAPQIKLITGLQVLRSASNSASSYSGHWIEIMDEGGLQIRYQANQLIDVFYPSTERLVRIEAAQIEPDMHIVVLVDNCYDRLFERVLDAIATRRPHGDSFMLNFWQEAKQKALARTWMNINDLWKNLHRKGLSVDLQAFSSYFAEEDEQNIAPQSLDDFKLLAQFSGIYPDDATIHEAFQAIQRERSTRRTSGKALRRLLVQLAGGRHFDAAYESAKVLGTSIDDIAATIALVKVKTVQTLRSSGLHDSIHLSR